MARGLGRSGDLVQKTKNVKDFNVCVHVSLLLTYILFINLKKTKKLTNPAHLSI